MRIILFGLSLLLSVQLHAQFTYVLEQDIPVQADKNILRMPWAGGLNAAQYNTMDLNEDGKDDLVLFDRMADKVFTFLNQDNQYVYAPEYEDFFPEEITNWLLLRDHNCDGLKDIFTGDIYGMKVYTNITQPQQPLAWQQFSFYAGLGSTTKSPALLTKGFGVQKINLQMQFDDLPAIVDADGDGDLDIFSIRFAGNGTIEFHKNFSMERYASCDSLDFERVTNTWGGVTECSCENFAFNNAICDDTGGRVEHAGGKSLLMIDATNDGILDAILSEADCPYLELLENEGDLLNATINSNVKFPLSNPASLTYPVAFFEDVDFDGVKDLVSTPNISTKPFLNTNLKRSNWLYKNAGSNTNPSFVFSKNNFLQEHMIDVGDNAVPAFADMDNDGDYDLFISHNASDVIAAKVEVFENIGSASEPQFKLFEDNFLNLSQLALINVKIQFADINNDSKDDLVYTATSYSDGITRLNFIPNLTSGFNFSLSDIQTIELPNYNLASTENILVADVNIDGKADLLHGRSNGALYFWKGMGSLNFTLEDDTYLEIGSSVLRQNLACAISDLDADGTSDLIIGDQTGNLRVVSNFRQAINAEAAVTNLVWNSISETYKSHNLGGKIWPTVVNLFSTNKPSIVVGNILGGVSILRNNNEGALPENPIIKLYPNPVQRNNFLNVIVDRAASLEVFSVTGQSIYQDVVNAHQMKTIETIKLAVGIYILRITVNNKSFAKRFVVY